jgi:hypothetical protein
VPLAAGGEQRLAWPSLDDDTCDEAHLQPPNPFHLETMHVSHGQGARLSAESPCCCCSDSQVRNRSGWRFAKSVQFWVWDWRPRPALTGRHGGFWAFVPLRPSKTVQGRRLYLSEYLSAVPACAEYSSVLNAEGRLTGGPSLLSPQ